MPAHLHTISPEDLVAALVAGQRRALATVLTELERETVRTQRVVEALKPHLGGAGVIGITGPPGAGKSTLVNALIGALRAEGRRVGVIAVDPSSPISGGAILGDRLRMSAASGDDGVFVRSLSASGHLGGLTPAAVRMIDGLDAAGFDVVILETVGTGQSEVDVAEVADVRVVVAAPGLGDDVQAMKSGLLEIADLMVVNKADRPGAEQTRQHLAGALSLSQDGTEEAPVLLVSAMTGMGIAELAGAIERRLDVARATPAEQRRNRRGRYLLGKAAVHLIMRQLSAPEHRARIQQLADDLMAGRRGLAEAVRRLLDV